MPVVPGLMVGAGARTIRNSAADGLVLHRRLRLQCHEDDENYRAGATGVDGHRAVPGASAGGAHRCRSASSGKRTSRRRMIGKTIDHYLVLEKLGKSESSMVFKAQDLKLDRVVLLKAIEV